MRRLRYIAERETIVDHLVSAVLSALAMVLTVALGPIVAGMKAGSSDFPEIYAHYGPVHTWGTILVTVAFVVGLVAGPRRMAELYGHFWGTEQPEKPWLTYSLWAGVAAIVAFGYWLAP